MDIDRPHAGLTRARPHGFGAVFADGHVQMIPRDVAADELAAMLAPAD